MHITYLYIFYESVCDVCLRCFLIIIIFYAFFIEKRHWSAVGHTVEIKFLMINHKWIEASMAKRVESHCCVSLFPC